MFFYLFTFIINLTTPEFESSIAISLLPKTKEKLMETVNLVNADTFDYQAFKLENPSVGLTNMAGFYVMIHVPTKEFYFGCSVDLAERQREYRYQIRNETARDKLPKKLEILVRETSARIQDFCFVPLTGFPKLPVLYPFNIVETEKGFFLRTFLENKIEKIILTEVLANPQLKLQFLNVVVTGAFQVGNTFGGSPTSGDPDKPLAYEDKYAWESLSAAARTLKRDRKAVRNKRDSGVLREISPEMFASFKGKKITNNESKVDNFFSDEELNALRRALGMRRDNAS